jgi:hypothetical protein
MVDAEFLGYRYPETLVFRVTGHARRMRQKACSAADRSLRMGRSEAQCR